MDPDDLRAAFVSALDPYRDEDTYAEVIAREDDDRARLEDYADAEADTSDAAADDPDGADL